MRQNIGRKPLRPLASRLSPYRGPYAIYNRIGKHLFQRVVHIVRIGLESVHLLPGKITRRNTMTVKHDIQCAIVGPLLVHLSHHIGQISFLVGYLRLYDCREHHQQHRHQ